MCPDLKVHDVKMQDSVEEKYLGDQIHQSAKNVKTLSKRRAKGYGILSDIIFLIESIPNGKRKIEVGLELRQSWFLNSTLLNMETWHNMKENDLNELKKLDQYLLRKIIGAHSKVPVELLYLETSTTPLDFILKSRRINYLHTILNRNDTELTKKIYNAQKLDPVKGDWVTLVKEDLETIEIHLSEEEIVKTKKTHFKKLVRKYVKDAVFKKLKDMQKEHTKIKDIKYDSFKIQPYLVSDTLNPEQTALLFNLRANTVNGFKMCFTSIYRNDLKCKLGCQENDTLAHCISCKVIDTKMHKSSNINFNAIFATNEVQKNIVLKFTYRMNIRNSLIEQEVRAYQGSQILDNSTPALAGGAGD